MANLTITNTFSPNTVISSSQVNTNYTDIKTWLNNRDNATDYWLNMKVNATASNPGEIKSSAADCEFDIDSTGTNGTPRVSWRRSGSTLFTAGVDGAASNLWKIGTTALTTNVAMQIPTTGVQVQIQSLASIASPTAAADNVNVAGKLWISNQTGGALTLNGLAGGVIGQLLYIFNVDAVQNLTITNNNAGGTQKFLTPGAASMTITPRGGGTFIFDSSSFWVCVSQK